MRNHPQNCNHIYSIYALSLSFCRISNQELDRCQGAKSYETHHIILLRAGGWAVAYTEVLQHRIEHVFTLLSLYTLPYHTARANHMHILIRKEVICCLIHFVQPPENTRFKFLWVLTYFSLIFAFHDWLAINTPLIMSLLPSLHPAGKDNASQSPVTIHNAFYNEITASSKGKKEGNIRNFP